MRRFSLSCTKVSFIPSSFAPPHPKQWLAGFGASVMVAGFLSCALSVLFTPVSSVFDTFLFSNQRNPAALGTPNAALPLPHLDAQKFRQDHHPARNLLFVQACKAQAQRIRQWILRIKIASRREKHSTLLRMNQQLAGVKSGRQFQPEAHAA